MNSQLYVCCKVLAIVGAIAAALACLLAMDESAQPGPAGVCIASALVLGMSLVAMAILRSSDRRDSPANP